MSNLKQLLAGTAANIGTIASGMTLGFSAVALPAMKSDNHVPPVTDEQASWIASLASMGMPAGALLMGPLLDGLGRRRTLMLVNTPSILGWLLIASASLSEPWFFYQVYAGRLLTGLAVGLVTIPAVVYSSEVIDKQLRGVVVTWPSIGVSSGILLVYVLGYIFQDNWRLVAGITTCVPLISTIAVWYFLPESPVWLVARGNILEAEASMRLVRNVPRDECLPDHMQEELDAMISNNNATNQKSSWKDTLLFLKRPEAYKPLLIFNAFFFFQQFSGIFVIVFYAVMIVKETGIKFDEYLATVLIGVCRLLMAFVISFASRRYGRRLLCNISGVGMTISTAALALYLSLKANNVISPSTAADYSWISLTALLLSVISHSLGFLTLPFAMMGEVFPAKIRGSACGFTTFNGTIFFFIAIKLFPDMKEAMGYHNLFAFYAAVIAAGTVCMYFCLPETQGKTLQEIQDHFKNKGRSPADYVQNHKASIKLIPLPEPPEKILIEDKR